MRSEFAEHGEEYRPAMQQHLLQRAVLEIAPKQTLGRQHARQQRDDPYDDDGHGAKRLQIRTQAQPEQCHRQREKSYGMRRFAARAKGDPQISPGLGQNDHAASSKHRAPTTPKP